jgi:hypothetical protein
MRHHNTLHPTEMLLRKMVKYDADERAAPLPSGFGPSNKHYQDSKIICFVRVIW